MRVIFFLLLLISGVAYGQSTYYIRADSVRLQKVGGNTNLILENGSRSKTGAYLRNYSNGRTDFNYAVDSAYISGTDLILVRGMGSQNFTLPIPGAATPNLQQTTDVGDTTDNFIRFDKLRSTIGVVFTDNFTGGSFGGNYNSSLTTVTPTFGGSFVTVDGGNGTFANYIAYTQWTGRNKYTQSVKFMPLNSTGTTYGVSLGTESFNSAFPYGVRVQFSVDNGGFSGKILYWDDAGNLLATSPTGLAFSVNDSLVATLNRKDNVFTATLQNINTGASLEFSQTVSTASVGAFVTPGTGKFALYFNGGNQKIFNWTVSSEEAKNSVVLLGNSITSGYSASDNDHKWAALVFPGRYSYEISGGPGDRTDEGINLLEEIKISRPQYVLYGLGVNNAQAVGSTATYSSNTQQILDTLIANNIIPIILSNCPNNGVDLTPYNDTLIAIAARYGLQYINFFDSLRSGTAWATNYDADGVHPNDSGHFIISRIITREAYHILGDTVIKTNRVRFNPLIRYVFGLNEINGNMELTTLPDGATVAAPGNFGNVPINRNGLFVAPGSDSLTYTAGLSVKGTVSATTTINATTGYKVNSAAGSGTFLRGDGTNYIASTLTIPNTSTSGQIVHSTAANTYGGSANLVYSGNQLLVQPGSNSAAALKINIASGNTSLQVGSYAGFPQFTTMHFGNIVDDGTNYIIFSDGITAAGFNAPSGAYLGFNIGHTEAMRIDASRFVHIRDKLVMDGARFTKSQGADVASAAGAITLGMDGNVFEITGTAAITLISNLNWQNGSEVTLLFTSTASLTDGTANSGTDIGMELAGNTNFTGSAGATITLILSEIGGTQRWREKARSVN